MCLGKAKPFGLQYNEDKYLCGNRDVYHSLVSHSEADLDVEFQINISY